MDALRIIGAYALALFIGWCLGRILKLKPKPVAPDYHDLMRSLLSKAEYGCRIISTFDPDPKKRYRAKKYQDIIFTNQLALGFNKPSGRKVSIQWLLNLAKVWDEAPDGQKKEIHRWLEWIT